MTPDHQQNSPNDQAVVKAYICTPSAWTGLEKSSQWQLMVLLGSGEYVKLMPLRAREKMQDNPLGHEEPGPVEPEIYPDTRRNLTGPPTKGLIAGFLQWLHQDDPCSLEFDVRTHVHLDTLLVAMNLRPDRVIPIDQDPKMLHASWVLTTMRWYRGLFGLGPEDLEQIEAIYKKMEAYQKSFGG
ncbi:hypothetical protein LQW54_005729 [Pestalotiopsis sp. IQ-011]